VQIFVLSSMTWACPFLLIRKPHLPQAESNLLHKQRVGLIQDYVSLRQKWLTKSVASTAKAVSHTWFRNTLAASFGRILPIPHAKVQVEVDQKIRSQDSSGYEALGKANEAHRAESDSLDSARDRRRKLLPRCWLNSFS